MAVAAVDLVSLAPTAPSSRHTIAMDSTAVLAFDDGVHIPCDRFIMRCFCPVLRRLLEDAACSADPLGRTILPVPAQASEHFWDAVDVLHGCSALWTYDLPRLLRVAECLDYLGVTIYDGAVDARLWGLLKDSSFDALMPHAPRFLRNPVIAPAIVCRLVKHRPTWARFRDDVLGSGGLGPLDHGLVKAIVHYAPNFFPAFMVVMWALDACPALDADTAMHLCRHHGVLYHPAETPLVLRALADALELSSPTPFAKVLRMAVASSEKFDVVPCTANRAHGSVLMYTDSPTASALLTFPGGRLPAHIRVAPWLKVVVTHDGRLDVELKPRRMIDDPSAACPQVQLRVMAYPAATAATATTAATAAVPAWQDCEEVWYAFPLGPGGARDEVFTLARATKLVGTPSALAELVGSTHMQRRVRFDFFYGATSVLECPFDAAKCPSFIHV